MLVKLNGTFDLPQIAVRISQITEAVAFATAIANVAGNVQRLLVKLNGTFDLPQRIVHIPQIAEVYAFAAAVADFA